MIAAKMDFINQLNNLLFLLRKTFLVLIGIGIDSRLFILKLLKAIHDIWKKAQQIYFNEPTEVVSR